MILMSVKFLSEIAVRCQFIKVDRDRSRLDNKIRKGLASLFVNFVVLCVKVFAACANFLGALPLRKQDNTRAKSPSDRPEACHPERMRGIYERFLSSFEMTMLFLCAFARDIPAFERGFAALVFARRSQFFKFSQIGRVFAPRLHEP